MIDLLPWLLILLMDGRYEAETRYRFATQEECIHVGESLSLRILVDLQLAGHTVDPKCIKLLPKEQR